MGKSFQRRDILSGVSAGICFLAGCIGEQESNGEMCTFSTEESFETDYIESLNYMGSDNDNGEFRMDIHIEVEPDELENITVYDESGTKIANFDVTSEEMELSWEIDERPSDKSFELIGYDTDGEIDRSLVQAECK